MRSRPEKSPSSGLRQALAEVAELVLPWRCSLCDLALEVRPIGALCPTCWQQVLSEALPAAQCACVLSDRPPDRAHNPARIHPLLVHSWGLYAPVSRLLLTRLKGADHWELAASCAYLLQLALVRLAARASDQGVKSLRLIPIPTSPAALRRRGDWPLRVILRMLSPHQIPLSLTVDLRELRLVGRVRDQVGLNVRQRAQNVQGSMRALGRAPSVAGEIMVLVDDVVTTGATLLEAQRALGLTGATRLQAVTILNRQHSAGFPLTLTPGQD